MDRLNTAPLPVVSELLLEDGHPWPLGAQFDGDGVNFAVCAERATRVELCLFDSEGRTELARLALPARSADVWHGRLPQAEPGLVYGLRVHGPWQPAQGLHFDAEQLLLDPWAREIVAPDGDPEGWIGRGADACHSFKARVVADEFDWRGDRPPATPLADTVLYELHVRGFTRRMETLPAELRGSYAGLGSDAAIAHLQRLGITAVSLLPVHQCLDEPRLQALGLRNYWGYNTLGFFCPDPRLAQGPHARDEFRTMVRRLHRAGIEVLLDVVFNHTAEGDATGPTLSWRGLDPLSWYRVDPAHGAAYVNWSGCGNTLDLRQPRVLQLVLDSLRYWVGEMHVDGFRFDLAPVLGRASPDFDRDGPFFRALQQDPLLQRVKLIAEPWDLGPGGYQLGQFPRGWLEWNDRFRDTARAFWLGGDCTRGEFALRLAGSSDLFQQRGRSPVESVNYVVSHDGFTLADLVSYDLRHNEANGEDNRDGTGNNLSWNCGWEGPTDDPEVRQCRARLQRALLATTLLAQGTPMIAAGDELGHSQGGNNNPYCQDNDTSWIDWSRADQSLIDFTAHVIALRRRLMPFDLRWYSANPDEHGVHDLAWLRRNARPMAAAHWEDRSSRTLGVAINVPGRSVEALLLLVNASDRPGGFALPPGEWIAELDTTVADGRSSWRGADVDYPLAARSLVLLRRLDAAATESLRSSG